MRISTVAVALLLAACTQTVGGLDEATKGGASRGGTADAGAIAADRTAAEATPCETVLAWTGNATPACDACVSDACDAEVSELRSASNTCSSSYEQAGSCSTCACADGVLAKRAVCKAPWDAFFACKAAHCGGACR